MVSTIFDRRIRGFRWVDLAAMGCLALLVLGVYAVKAGAGRESAQIVDVDRQIADERRDIRLLRAEIGRLEQPARLERLSTTYLGMGPVGPREVEVDGLSELARRIDEPAPRRSSSPAVAAAVGSR